MDITRSPISRRHGGVPGLKSIVPCPRADRNTAAVPGAVTACGVVEAAWLECAQTRNDVTPDELDRCVGVQTRDLDRYIVGADLGDQRPVRLHKRVRSVDHGVLAEDLGAVYGVGTFPQHRGV